MQNYEVKKHDTLWKIAREHGVTVDRLARANRLKGRQIHFIREGQNLLIPGPGQAKPDTTLSIRFRGLDHSGFTPRKIKVEHDKKVIERQLDSDGILSLGIFDHADGLKVWIEDISKQFVKVLDRPFVPIGTWKLAIDSRQVGAKGNLLPKRGPSGSTTPEVKAGVTHNAQVASGSTARAQTRVDGGKPVHAIASLYTQENLRLSPGNERYRSYIIAAARRHQLTPQSLAALVDAEAAKDSNGVWQEKSNISKPKRAQGLAQFFPAAWTDVSNHPGSLLHAEAKRLSRTELLAKRHEAQYAIDGAAVYAVMNLKNFSRRIGRDTSTLAPEDKAKLAYLLHHEGLDGALRIVGKGSEWTNEAAAAQLLKQFGDDPDRAEKWLDRFDNDAKQAYIAWIYSYTDAKINVNSFLIKDKAAFATAPRSIEVIIKGLLNAPAPPKPKPRVATPAPAPKPTAPPSQTRVSGSGRWHDPLDVCTLRTANLASVRSAKFGMTRNGGKRAHQGIDLIASPGTAVYAVADGTVHLGIAPNASYAYGNTLILVVKVDDLPEPQASVFRKINPDNKTIGFFYAHLGEFCVKGGPVSAGQLIAKSGSSGNAANMTTIATGAHLHFEVRKKALVKAPGLTNRVDPLLFLPKVANK